MTVINGLVFLIVLASITVVTISIILTVVLVNKKYKNFVLEHSEAIKHLREINKSFHFEKVKSFDMYHSYDNENIYPTISCMDYLIYQLVKIDDDVIDAMNKAAINQISYKKYKDRIKNECEYNNYDVDKLPRNKKLLEKTEMKQFNIIELKPVTKFSINVELALTNMNGNVRARRRETFHPEKIRELIKDVNDKRGYRYEWDYIWDAICRVERGKVTNRMRFFIYERDHYRCRICGRKTNDLEIDHIIPISRGGKSTVSNLQTLCHRCNVRKGTN